MPRHNRIQVRLNDQERGFLQEVASIVGLENESEAVRFLIGFTRMMIRGRIVSYIFPEAAKEVKPWVGKASAESG